ncbi:MAG: SDR family oxidoreductase [Pseudomonadales bacterium]|nr:SDR family oxidoreductase [Pseudomonadales bacterium]
MKELTNTVAAVTGAASGIGQAVAIGLAREGCHVAVSDINETGLQDTVKILESMGAVVTAQKLDVTDRSAMEAWAAKIAAELGGINIIVNNAGVGLSATVEDMSYEDFEWLMDINFWGVVYGTKAFLPYLQKEKEGHIVNISSVAGIVSAPTGSAYCAAKFAVRGFTESLRQELEIGGSNVSCTTIHPGGIKTNIAKTSRVTESEMLPMDQEEMADDFSKLALTTPEGAAKVIIEGIQKNKRRVLIGNDARVIDIVQRILPTAYQRLVSTGMKFTFRNRKSKSQSVASPAPVTAVVPSVAPPTQEKAKAPVKAKAPAKAKTPAKASEPVKASAPAKPEPKKSESKVEASAE